jgi:hypothetical protein
MRCVYKKMSVDCSEEVVKCFLKECSKKGYRNEDGWCCDGCGRWICDDCSSDGRSVHQCGGDDDVLYCMECFKNVNHSCEST